MKTKKAIFEKRYNGREYVSYTLKRGANTKISGQIYIPRDDSFEHFPDYIELTAFDKNDDSDNELPYI